MNAKMKLTVATELLDVPIQVPPTPALAPLDLSVQELQAQMLQLDVSPIRILKVTFLKISMKNASDLSQSTFPIILSVTMMTQHSGYETMELRALVKWKI